MYEVIFTTLIFFLNYEFLEIFFFWLKSYFVAKKNLVLQNSNVDQSLLFTLQMTI